MSPPFLDFGGQLQTSPHAHTAGIPPPAPTSDFLNQHLVDSQCMSFDCSYTSLQLSELSWGSAFSLYPSDFPVVADFFLFEALPQRVRPTAFLVKNICSMTSLPLSGKVIETFHFVFVSSCSK